ncbi:MAG: hypothetical protein ABIW46_03140 [Acidimicrobiales bacterium]
MNKRTRLLLAIAIVLVAGLGIVGYLAVTDIDENEETDDRALGTTTPDEESPLLTTSTTTAGASDLSTTSTTGSSSTTTTRAPTTTTTVAGGSTTTSTTRPPAGGCGTGTARATFTAKDLVTTPTESAFVPEARVENLINRPIEVEILAADVGFPDGSIRKVTFTTAGVVIAPNTTGTFAAERIVTPAQYSSAKVSGFAYFTSGLRDRCRVSLPTT